MRLSEFVLSTLVGACLLIAPAIATAMPDEGTNVTRQRISTGSKWEDLAAYSRAVVDDRWVFVSGTVGFDPKDSSIPDDFDSQMDLIFQNLQRTLAMADASLSDIVQVRCYLVDRAYVEQMSAGLHKYLSDIRPTNTTIITQLAPVGALIEIEVTALKKAVP